MYSIPAVRALLPLLAAGVMAWPQNAAALDSTANYGLAHSAPALTVSPMIQSDARFSGAGLSVSAGQNWFAQVAIGRSLQPGPVIAGGDANDAMSVAGGYRWSDGHSLSLQVTSGRGAERLGLAVRYDWPRYFVRLSYDSRLNLVPQDSLRFSAGVRF